MKLYKMMYTKKGDFLTGAKDIIYWDLKAKEGAVIVYSESECEDYNTQYAIEFDTDKLSIEVLMDVIYKKLSFSEAKIIFETEPVIQKLFLAYLSNPMFGEQLKKMMENIEDTSSNIELMSFINLIKK